MAETRQEDASCSTLQLPEAAKETQQQQQQQQQQHRDREPKNTRRRRMSSGTSATPSHAATPEPGAFRAGRRGRLEQMRSLDGNDSSRRQLSSPSRGPVVAASGKQSFSLRQLALNSRALAGGAKKSRGGIPTSEGAARPLGGALSKLLEFSNGSSSGGEATTSSFTPVQDSGAQTAADHFSSGSMKRRESGDSYIRSRPEQNSTPAEGVAENNKDDEEEKGGEDEDVEDFGEDDDDEAEEEEEYEDDDEDEDEKVHSRSSCKCQPLVSGLDQFGRPVSDVDLISYRDLCQLAQAQLERNLLDRQQSQQQQQQQQRQQQQQQQHLLRLHSNCSTSNRQYDKQYQLSVSSSCTSSRRASLQEESGAYYQLCTPHNEQVIRAKYAWCPPSLMTCKLDLVDRFFASLHAHKVPLLNSQGATYREEQISFQLAKQDISLEYLRYPLVESARQAYAQFVERRNSHALHVGLALELPELGRARAAQELKGVPASSVAVGATGGGVSAGPRCRRCLVRFEPKQLAILAPSFLIGSSSAGGCKAVSRNLLHSLSQPELSNAALFHPNCFTCSTCRELLVDLVYCLRDNKLYCFRHYGDSLRPRCAWCQEVSWYKNSCRCGKREASDFTFPCKSIGPSID